MYIEPSTAHGHYRRINFKYKDIRRSCSIRRTPYVYCIRQCQGNGVPFHCLTATLPYISIYLTYTEVYTLIYLYYYAALSYVLHAGKRIEFSC